MGIPQIRPAKGTSASSITVSQRRPRLMYGLFRRAADRIIEMAGGTDVRPPPALKGMVDPDDDRPIRGESGDQRLQQGARQDQAGPDIAIEHAVEAGKADILGQTQRPQAVGDGAQTGANRQRRHGCAAAPGEGTADKAPTKQRNDAAAGESETT